MGTLDQLLQVIKGIVMSATTNEVGADGSEFVKPKVVEKVFNLPLVTDAYDSLANLSTPMHPYMEKAGSLASPVATTFTAGMESMTPEVLQTGYNSAKGQVAAAAASVDASLCSGVDSLVDKVPVLKWTSNEKVESIMMGLRRVRSDLSTVRKEGVIRNGTEKAKEMEEASLLWAVLEIAGLPNFYTLVVPNEGEEGCRARGDAVKKDWGED